MRKKKLLAFSITAAMVILTAGFMHMDYDTLAPSEYVDAVSERA